MYKRGKIKIGISLVFLVMIFLFVQVATGEEDKFTEAGLNVNDFWSSVDSANQPTLNVSELGVITSDKTVYTCLSGFCTVYWNVKPDSLAFKESQLSLDYKDSSWQRTYYWANYTHSSYL